MTTWQTITFVLIGAPLLAFATVMALYALAEAEARFYERRHRR